MKNTISLAEHERLVATAKHQERQEIAEKIENCFAYDSRVTEIKLESLIKELK